MLDNTSNKEKPMMVKNKADLSPLNNIMINVRVINK